MNQQKFEVLRKFLINASGLSLQSDKMYLIDSRLAPIAKKYECDSVEDLVSLLERRPTEALRTDVIEAMTTNETSFFRDANPFEAFKSVVIPELIEARSAARKIRILCAASSSGQEPYSLAMSIAEHFPQIRSWNIEIIGTDIDHQILKKAQDGRYSKFEVQRGLPITFLLKYFDKETENTWRIKQSIRDKVRFEHGNLLKCVRHLGRFDVIFCRNVLIYFDMDVKAQVLGRLSECLPDDGTLVLGGAETVLGVSEKFKPRLGTRGLYVTNRAQPSVMAA